MNEKTITHDESMEIIQRMILTAKNRITENGFHFILWGVLIIIASLAEYFNQKSGLGIQANLSWIVMPLIGVPTAFIYEFRRNRSNSTRSFVDTWYKYLWLGFGITLAVAITISVKQHLSPIPFILALVGFATFVSGNLYKSTPLIIGGIIFWISSLLCLVVPAPEQLLINAAATLTGYIIPGILLWKNSKSESDV
ncbi:MAG: hypothetical protein HOO86_16865 [Bacteroidales bacterium]|nr:hypothetical protein [Bacteroidales bacterium]